ncbi:MAG: LLM class flavin-dependent oxidoreductase, partial [Mycobacterium sp.]
FDFLILDPAVGPDPFPALAALAAVCDQLGLVGSVDTTSNEPFAVARQLATLDHLSGGRAGWSVGPPPGRADRAEEFVTATRAFLDSWAPGAVLADDGTGVYVDAGQVRVIEHHGVEFDVRGAATLPAGPQGFPVLLQDGDSAEGCAEHADILVASHLGLLAGRKYGRGPGRPKVFMEVSVAGQLGGTAERVAAELDRYVQSDVCDGFVLAPGGLDEFVESVIPLLQDRGAFPTEYEPKTLRDRLGP